MITAESSFVAIGDGANKKVISFKGLSTDTKPTGTYLGMEIQNGSSFFEMDTMKAVFYDGESQTWLEED